MDNLGLYFDKLENDLSHILDCIEWDKLTYEQTVLLKSIENHLNTAKEEADKILKQQGLIIDNGGQVDGR